MKENKASITIAAPPHEVWKVLTDLPHYHEWNPLFVQANGTIEEGESLHIKMRLPITIFCGAPLSYSWSPRIIKVVPESLLEWFAPAAGIKGFIDGTHYFQLTSIHGGAFTEFTQGERYEGWGTGLYSGLGTMQDARRGFVAMNNALNLETMRRLEESSGEHTDNTRKRVRGEEDEIAQLDISDPVAVATLRVRAVTRRALVTADGEANEEADATLKTDQEVKDAAISTSNELAVAAARSPAEKPENRTSIIGAVSSLFSSSKPSPSDRLPPSSFKPDLASKTVLEEQGETVEVEGERYDDAAAEEEEEEVEEEDLAAKMEREAKNAERIELDLGSTDMSLGDFSI
ncbi:hypothetical protein EDD21DRAFT_438663 [Dissophora ornata]|nr:hypothetical protein BGZ58_008351 [Dissophora ornata]KAI8596681.1 hypothetical protein EDD21DRAFT_438663 [Dissophora ornata]